MRKNLRNEKASVMPFEETPTVCVCRRTLPHLVAKWSASWVSGLVGYCNFILISIINIDIFSFSIRMEPVLRNNKKNQCKNLKFVATFLRKPHLIDHKCVKALEASGPGSTSRRPWGVRNHIPDERNEVPEGRTQKTNVATLPKTSFLSNPWNWKLFLLSCVSVSVLERHGVKWSEIL